MCFSANASFGAGVVLSAIGILSLKKTQHRSQIAFASVPLIFAAQQITEGFLWLALADPVNTSLQVATTYLFLFFAQVVWPTFVPLSVLMIERDNGRKGLLRILTAIGILVSGYLAYCLAVFDVQASVVEYHISYRQDYPLSPGRFGGLLYVIATIAPPLLSAVPRMRLVGLTIFVAYVISKVFYEDHIVSVWCFFASVISIAVFAVIKGITDKSAIVSDVERCSAINHPRE